MTCSTLRTIVAGCAFLAIMVFLACPASAQTVLMPAGAEWKYLDDLPVKEIAERIELKTKAAESLLTRARNSFREIYARLQVGPRHERE